MPRIRHIAISYKDEDCEAIATFYKEVFGMTEMSRKTYDDHPDVKFINLTDGYLHLAIVPSFVGYEEGINHIGFEVENFEDTRARAIAAGGKPGEYTAYGRVGGDFVLDPGGVRLDLDEKGWNAGSPARIKARREEAGKGENSA